MKPFIGNEANSREHGLSPKALVSTIVCKKIGARLVWGEAGHRFRISRTPGGYRRLVIATLDDGGDNYPELVFFNHLDP